MLTSKCGEDRIMTTWKNMKDKMIATMGIPVKMHGFTVKKPMLCRRSVKEGRGVWCLQYRTFHLNLSCSGFFLFFFFPLDRSEGVVRVVDCAVSFCC